MYVYTKLGSVTHSTSPVEHMMKFELPTQCVAFWRIFHPSKKKQKTSKVILLSEQANINFVLPSTAFLRQVNELQKICLPFSFGTSLFLFSFYRLVASATHTEWASYISYRFKKEKKSKHVGFVMLSVFRWNATRWQFCLASRLLSFTSVSQAVNCIKNLTYVVENAICLGDKAEVEVLPQSVFPLYMIIYIYTHLL